MIKPSIKLKRRYNLFESCVCGKNVHIVYDKTCCGIDHLQNSLNQENDGEKEWLYHLNRIERCLYRLNKENAKKERLELKLLSDQKRAAITDEIKSLEKPKHEFYYDTIGRLRLRKRGKTWAKKINVELRNAILKRDKNKCVECKCKTGLHVHHIVHRSKGGTDDQSNLKTLCDLCHAEAHRGEPIYNLMVKSLFEYKAI